jgi:hypothetical protein
MVTDDWTTRNGSRLGPPWPRSGANVVPAAPLDSLRPERLALPEWARAAIGGRGQVVALFC